MAHYAFLSDDNIVTEVITGRNEWEEVDGITDWEKAYGDYRGQKCVRTSYHGNIRYNFASIGYTYDPIDDAFIEPMPQCGHDDLLLNAQKRWECDECKALVKRSRETA